MGKTAGPDKAYMDGSCSTWRIWSCIYHSYHARYYVARAKGVPKNKVLWKYPVRASINPVVSTIGWELATIVSGSPITATVLSLPDIGPIFLKALGNQDVYLSGTILLIYSCMTIIGTFVSDLLLAMLDPRIRLGGN